MWNIRKIVKKGDYLYAVVPEHPKASKHGYVLEHRVVMENKLGRLLKDDEIVHHKNHDKHDNRNENLELMDRSEHTRLHMSTGRTTVQLKCPNCKKKFVKEKRFLKGKKRVFCSRRCNGQFSRKIQLGMIGG